MKHMFTHLLPLVAGLLLHSLFTQAQAIDFPGVPSGLTQPTALPASALRHALPSTGKASATQLPKLPVSATSRASRAVRLGATGSQAQASGAVSEQWVARYTTPDNSYDVATGTAVDAVGNVYVTGYSFQDASNHVSYDYLTIKYSAEGAKRWEARYSGSANGDEVAKAIAVDTAGNVYVTGSSYNGTNYDYATVKYDGASGQQLWAARYDGAANSDDLATSLAVDAAGNVLVTGASYNGPTTSYDYVTVKYSSVGAQLWTTRYSGSGASDELPTTLAVDTSGNVYVTGNAYAGNQGDYLTLKYSTAGGQPLWVARYNGPASGYDLVRDLAVDAAGNVVVTGTSDNGSSYDYATVRYSSSGQQLWAARYNGAGNSYDEATGVAVDAAGNVAVTGFADVGGGNWDYVTLMYEAASGQPLWQARYNGSDSSYEEAKDVVVDAAGNVAVTGRSYNSAGQSEYATVKYAGASGQPLWASRYSGATAGDEQAVSLAVDAGGNVVVTGISNTSSIDADYATLKYAAASGQQLWEARYTSAQTISHAIQATDMAVDAAGNVVVTGHPPTTVGSSYYATVKYSASGQKLWEARYASGFISNNSLAVDVDAAGNVYIAGSFNYEYTTIKYDGASGQQLWVRRYFPGGINRGNYVTDLAVDAAGNAYVTGASVMGITTGYDYATIKYSPTGERLWAMRHVSARNDIPSSLTLDVAGNAYVTGISYSEQFNRIECITIKYSPNGQQQWIARYNDPLREDKLTAIAVDAVGNVYVTGSSTLKYSPGGELLWTAQYFADGTALAIDAVGNVLVTGTGYLDANVSQGVWVTAKCDGATGHRLWQVFNGPGNTTDQAVDMALDAAGDVYVTGISVDGSTDYNTIKYAGSSGQVLWKTSDNSPSISSNRPVRVVVDAAGSVYVAGTTFANPSDPDYLTIKYSQSSRPASAAVLATARPALAASRSNVQELAVYPNPAAGLASVSFRPVQGGRAQVVVYNQLGQQMAILYEGTVHKGQFYELPLHSWKLPAGLYTCSLLVDGQRETVRLLVTQ
ncbi:SBBP repeat-containing protein [Hymenobacter sp. YC55]|uniref:SBBP repeat-containing protein n=1 Tax=Hymenobacter sp. YC55 TaxID=3034019 RepID=UPI0023F838BB|nr:SBBP repeat-containing protein [Hymenobacter sp. YC55]MDF7812048.1 SBBP repeat-containing protein [Hymenobacter sp. YC55]